MEKANAFSGASAFYVKVDKLSLELNTFHLYK